MGFLLMQILRGKTLVRQHVNELVGACSAAAPKKLIRYVSQTTSVHPTSKTVWAYSKPCAAELRRASQRRAVPPQQHPLHDRRDRAQHPSCA